METVTRDSLLPLLYSALDSPLGIKISTSNPHGLKKLIQSLRQQTKDELLSRFEIINSPHNPGGELWLVLLPDYRSPPNGEAKRD